MSGIKKNVYKTCVFQSYALSKHNKRPIWVVLFVFWFIYFN